MNCDRGPDYYYCCVPSNISCCVCLPCFCFCLPCSNDDWGGRLGTSCVFAIFLPIRVCVGKCCCESWNVNDTFDGTYLHGAAEYGNNYTASMLIMCCCADINAFDGNNKNTPLHRTISNGNATTNDKEFQSLNGKMKVMEILMDAGADPMIKNKVTKS